jgi:hypothetical protein
MDAKISTTSVEEGLDFACSLLSSAIHAEAESAPTKACSLLQGLTRYVELRYVGELLLALECLADLGRSCNQENARSMQFWKQLHWIAEHMQLSSDEFEGIGLPNE